MQVESVATKRLKRPRSFYDDIPKESDEDIPKEGSKVTRYAEAFAFAAGCTAFA